MGPVSLVFDGFSVSFVGAACGRAGSTGSNSLLGVGDGFAAGFFCALPVCETVNAARQKTTKKKSVASADWRRGFMKTPLCGEASNLQFDELRCVCSCA